MLLKRETESNGRRTAALVVVAAMALAAVAVAVVPGAVAADAPTAEPVELNESVDPGDGTNLTIVQYNDIQTAMASNESMATLVGAINDRKAALDNPTLVVGGGDEVSPSSLSAVSEWRVPVDVLNVLNPAAEAIGNHDLDYGFAEVGNFSDASEFPWLVANIRAEDGGNIPGTQNYTTVTRDGVKIGIMGLVDDAVMPKTAVDFEEKGYEVTDFSTAGQQVAETLEEEENVDVVVALSHIGIPESRELANNTDNIDVIVSGDDEVTYGPEVTSGSVIVEAGANAEFLGEVNLTVTEDGVGFTDGRRYNLGEGNWSMNESADEVVQRGFAEDLSQVAGETTEALDSTSGNYADDTNWGRIIGDAFVEQTGADVAVTNAGGIRGNFVIDEGNITYNDVYTSLPFGNTLVTKEMTGQQLLDLLDSQVTPPTDNYGSQPQLQVGGVTYEFLDQPKASPAIGDVYVDGEPIAMDETYDVTVNSYMAGWDSLASLPTVDEDYTLYGTAVVNYIEERGTISPPEEDRIRRVTRSLDDPSIASEGEMTTLTYDVPEAVESINESTFTVMNEDSETVAVADATLSDGQLTVTVETGALESLSASSDAVTVYGHYADSEVDAVRNGHDDSVLAADATLAVDAGPALGPDVSEDHDGDGLAEDVDGDGAVDVTDVRTLLNNRHSAAVQNNVDTFDFDDDGAVDAGDVLALFRSIY
ncbi:UDP-sugar hydrolase protein [Halorhabdus tiamatea SARL4B]|uniref:UDP-sugar hydrolase / 5'-nucleotidase n=1 Tax=Halorhabdus tiamatea SARL4B TaxID=1033806 RepID=S6D115_9EURY|nr:5'-nucleotidase C-terminal domain-containing protein [Halorhabdus tiamatea]ERJ04608.1 UDP-sugar hydrolase protein [Halorhabdus tiamatea SARL4B]CCQ33848.1 UDP-sugar hydrolase / 5'-nucleotidase [Halorhabdus tiamatea SARL4B]